MDAVNVMGAWWGMLLNTLLVPVIMIVAGRLTRKYIPKKINPILGYRTALAMKNQETWKFANEYCGRLYERIGWVTLLVPVLMMLAVLRKSPYVMEVTGTAVVLIQCVLLLVPILPTQYALKKKFDKDGNPR